MLSSDMVHYLPLLAYFLSLILKVLTAGGAEWQLLVKQIPQPMFHVDKVLKNLFGAFCISE